MTAKAGLARLRQTGLGSELTDWSGLGLRVINLCTGKGAGRRYQPVVPGMGLVADIASTSRPDIKAMNGAEFIFKDFCPGSRWFADGSNLHPVGGVALVTQSCGSLANPISTLTLAAATGTFSGISATIPTGILIPGKSMIHVEALIRHTTATATANLNLRFGNNGNNSDTNAVAMNEVATTNQDTRMDCLISIPANGVDYNTTNTSSNQGHTTNGQNDRLASIVLTSPLKLSMDISAGTVGDVWKVTFFRVEILQ